MSITEVKLDDVVTISGGGTPSKKRPEFFTGEIPWVSPKDMKTWEITTSIDRITQEAVENSSAKLIDPEAVLLVIRSGVLKHSLPVGINRVPVTVNQDLKALRCGERILPDYLARYLQANATNILTKVRGTTADNIPTESLRQLPIPLPPLSEQKRIAEILDRAEALRAKRRAALALLDELTQSIFLEMFGDPVSNPKGWERVRFRTILDRIDSGWSPKCLDRPVQDNEWGVLKLGAVTWCKYNPFENKALPPGIDPRPELETQRGDLLFTRKNTFELVAACSLVGETPPKLMIPDLVFRFRFKEEAQVNSVFLQRLLTHPNKRKEIQRLAGGSSGSMPNISKSRLQTAMIELPPIKLQNEYAKRVESIEKLKRPIEKSLAELDELFASLQSRAFKGDLLQHSLQS